MKTILKETGLRNIKALADRYKKAKIYFHQDLDGVTTALAMKNYLENNENCFEWLALNLELKILLLLLQMNE